MRGHAARIVVLAFVPAVVLAKPLPTGLAIRADGDKLIAAKHGIALTLVAAKVVLRRAELADDGTIAIKYQCDAGGSETDLEVPLAELDAKFENMLGMQSHAKKKYADAIPHFARAVELDAATAMYATNLLSAQSLAGRLDDADKTIAALRSRNAAWLAWRLAVDPELQALAKRASTKLANARGTAKSSSAGVAYSPLGMVASEVQVEIWMGIPDGSSSSILSIVDVATGAELLALPLEKTCPWDMEAAMKGDPHPPPLDKACARREAAKAAANRKIADRVLADLGFTIADKDVRRLRGDDGDELKEIVGPGGVKLLLGDKWRLIGRDGKTRELGPEPSSPKGVSFIPSGVVVHNHGGKHVPPCDADGASRMELVPLVAK
jgi:hypothetical protein